MRREAPWVIIHGRRTGGGSLARSSSGRRSNASWNWARRSEAGPTTAVAANDDVVPASQLREAYARMRELERLLGRKQVEIEILEAARDVVKNSPWLRKGSGR